MSRFYTPYVIDTNAKGKEQEYHLGSRLLKDRIVIVSGEVNEDMAYIITGQLMHLDSLNSNPITMWINSPGGSVIDGLAIIDTMNFVKSKVSTVVTGMAASMGAAILSSGEKGMRYALPNAQIMVHQVSSGTRGHVEDMKISYKHSEYLNQLLMGMIAENTGMSLKRILVEADRDKWLTSREGLMFGRKGIIDKIITKAEDINALDI